MILERAERRFWTGFFAAADWNNDGEVSLTELGTMLDALAEDGISAQSLTYLVSSSGESKTDGLAASIIADFDWDIDGALGEDEFREFGSVLADELLAHRDWLGKSVRRVGPYVLSRTIGYGGEGLVKFAVNTNTDTPVALKVVPRGVLSQLGRVDAEIDALHTLKRSPLVLNLHEVLESDEYIFLVLELCGGGTLHDFIQQSGKAPIDEDVARFFFVAVCRALADAHAAGVVHRDVRVENVLLSNGGTAKLGDWGHSARFRQGWDLFDDPPGTVGSLHSASPEMLRPGPYSGVRADAWGLGVVLFCLLVKQRPFKGSTCAEVLNSIEKYDTVPVPASVSAEARMLLAQLMHPDPTARITPAQALESPWARGRLLKPAIMLGAIEVPPPPEGLDKPFKPAWGDALAALRVLRPDIKLQFGRKEGRVVRLKEGGRPLSTIPADLPIEGAPPPPQAGPGGRSSLHDSPYL